jgi:hypothetical protein
LESKKTLIRRIALVAAALLVAGLTGVGLSFAAAERDRQAREAQARRERDLRVEQAQEELRAMAERITGVPVDANAVGEIQAAHLARVPQGERYVWAVGTDGAFLFGVPREAFARLDRLWDEHEAVLQGDGLFVDRQDFLRRLVHVADGRPGDLLGEPDEPVETSLAEVALAYARDRWATFSAPLRAPDGAPLGDVYLEVELPRMTEPPDHLRGVLAASGAASAFAFGFLWFLLPTWVYADARERGVPRAALWSFLVLVSLFLGLVVYLIARPEAPGALRCPECAREVNGGAFCPHCGHDLGRAFCSACRYPLKPQWSFCPSCRTETAVARVPGTAPLTGES